LKIIFGDVDAERALNWTNLEHWRVEEIGISFYQTEMFGIFGLQMDESSL